MADEQSTQMPPQEETKKQVVVPTSQRRLLQDLCAKVIEAGTDDGEFRAQQFLRDETLTLIPLSNHPDVAEGVAKVISDYWRLENKSGVPYSVDLDAETLARWSAHTDAGEVHDALVGRITDSVQAVGVDKNNPEEHEWERREDMIGGLVKSLTDINQAGRLVENDIRQIYERLEAQNVPDDLQWSPRLLRQKVVDSLLHAGKDAIFRDLIEDHYDELGHTIMAKDSLMELLQSVPERVNRQLVARLIDISFGKGIEDDLRRTRIVDSLKGALEKNASSQMLINVVAKEMIKNEQEKRSHSMTEEERKHSDAVINAMLGHYNLMPEGVVDREAVRFLMQLATTESEEISRECSAKIVIGAGKEDVIPKPEAHLLPKDPSAYTPEIMERALLVLHEMEEFLAQHERYRGWPDKNGEVARLFKPHIQALATAAYKINDAKLTHKVKDRIRKFTLFTPPYANSFG